MQTFRAAVQHGRNSFHCASCASAPAWSSSTLQSACRPICRHIRPADHGKLAIKVIASPSGLRRKHLSCGVISLVPHQLREEVRSDERAASWQAAGPAVPPRRLMEMPKLSPLQLLLREHGRVCAHLQLRHASADECVGCGPQKNRMRHAAGLLSCAAHRSAETETLPASPIGGQCHILVGWHLIEAATSLAACSDDCRLDHKSCMGAICYSALLGCQPPANLSWSSSQHY